MLNDLSGERKNYAKYSIDDSYLRKLPFEIFDEWYKNAEKSKIYEEINAMTLSTVDFNNTPYARVVLLKFYSEKGFVFYTNYNSRKASHLDKNKNVCISFFWEHMEQQVIIKGSVEKLSENDSTDYFNKRPYESQLAAVASKQSSVLESREQLKSEWKELKEKYPHKIEKPKNWGGYLIKPNFFEFWQGGEYRLHDRICFTETNGNWKNKRLYP